MVAIPTLPSLPTSVDRRVLVGAAAAAAAAGGLLALRRLRRCCCAKRGPPDTPEKGDKDAEIVLVDGPVDLPGLASSPTPFVVKVETFLRIVGLPYKKVLGWPAEGPKGQNPYIRHGDLVIGDSELIIAYLGRTYGGKVQAAVLPDNQEQAGVALAVSRMCEGHLYYGMSYSRVVDPAGWAAFKAKLLPRLPVPALLRPLAARAMRKRTLGMLWSQGLARHSERDVMALLDADLKALSGVLGKKKFFCGGKPYAVDAVVFAILDQIQNDGMEPALHAALQAYPNLVRFVATVRKEFYGLE